MRRARSGASDATTARQGSALESQLSEELPAISPYGSQRLTTPLAAGEGEMAAPVLEEADVKPDFGPKDVVEEATSLLHLAYPLLIQIVFGYSLPFIAVIFVGHLHDSVLLSTLALANSFYNFTGYSVIIGVSAGMETLCGQAFGARRYWTLGVVLQRAVLICLCLCVPITLAWRRTAWFLQAIGQPPVIAAGVERYIMRVMPSLYIAAVFECLKRYLLTQRVVRPGMIITAITALLAPLYYWLLVFKLKLVLDGAAIAFLLCQLTTLILTLIYVVWRDLSLRGKATQTFHGCSREAFRGWILYLSYGVPAALIICLKWWAFELVMFLSGWLPTASVSIGVMGLCFQIIATAYMAASSIGSASSIRISNALGAGHPVRARLGWRIGFCCTLASQSTVGALVGLLRWPLANALTNSREVVEAMQPALMILAPAIAFDGVACVLSSVLRASGRQSLGAGVNIVTYWGVGLPLAWLFGFEMHIGVVGLWMGLITGSIVTVIGELVYVCMLNWDKEVARAAALVLQQQQQQQQQHTQPLLEAQYQEVPGDQCYRDGHA